MKSMSMVLRLSDAPETLEEARKLIDREEVKHRQTLAKLLTLRSLLREALPTIDGEIADAWRTGLKERIESALANDKVQTSAPENQSTPDTL